MLLVKRAWMPLLVSSGAVFATVVALGNLFPQQSPAAIQGERVIQKRMVTPGKASVSWEGAAPALGLLRSNATALPLVGPYENYSPTLAPSKRRDNAVTDMKSDATGNKSTPTGNTSAELVKSVQASSEYLNEKWLADKGGSVPLAYVESIKLDADLLGKLSEAQEQRAAGKCDPPRHCGGSGGQGCPLQAEP